MKEAMTFKPFASAMLLALCGHVSAAGLYDGIYQYGSALEWYSVHQSGNGMIVGNFISHRNFPIAWSLSNGQPYLSQTNDYWNLFGGTMSGASATLQGEVVAGACNVTLNANFSVAGRITVTITAVSPTVRGVAQGINCDTVLNMAGGNTFVLNKIY